MRPWSFQLYSARIFPPLARILKLLAKLGYSQVEGYGDYDNPRQLRSVLDHLGLTMPTIHIDLTTLRQSPNQAFQVSRCLGVGTIICPYLTTETRPVDTPGWIQLGDALMAVASQCRAAGFDFAWHNHDFEFKQLPDGQWPMKLLLDHTDIGWEMDPAWIVRAKSDPLVWIQKYGPRLQAVHLKDLAPAGENANEDGWSDVGFGTMNWPQLLCVLQSTPAKWWVMEHDKPNDLERFAKRSLATANKLVQ